MLYHAESRPSIRLSLSLEVRKNGRHALDAAASFVLRCQTTSPPLTSYWMLVGNVDGDDVVVDRVVVDDDVVKNPVVCTLYVIARA